MRAIKEEIFSIFFFTALHFRYGFSCDTSLCGLCAWSGHTHTLSYSERNLKWQHDGPIGRPNLWPQPELQRGDTEVWVLLGQSIGVLAGTDMHNV